MSFRRVRLASQGHALPPHYLTSDEIEGQLAALYDRLKLPAGRLELMTGIKRRGYWPLGTRPSSIAIAAAEHALGDFNRSRIGLLVHASVCRDFLEPATASVVHRALGLSAQCEFFDLSNACLGVVTAALRAAEMIESGRIEAALIVSGENSGPLLLKTIEKLQNDASITRQSIKRHIASLTIGSAGAAWLLTREELAPHAPRIAGAVSRVDSSAVELCQGSGSLEELVMETDSEELMKRGVLLASQTVQDYLQKFKRPQHIIPHQVGSTHRAAFLAALAIADARDSVSYELFGNTGSAALPLTLSLAQRSGELSHARDLLLAGIGSGLVSTLFSLEYV